MNQVALDTSLICKLSKFLLQWFTYIIYVVVTLSTSVIKQIKTKQRYWLRLLSSCCQNNLVFASSLCNNENEFCEVLSVQQAQEGERRDEEKTTTALPGSGFGLGHAIHRDRLFRRNL